MTSLGARVNPRPLRDVGGQVSTLGTSPEHGGTFSLFESPSQRFSEVRTRLALGVASGVCSWSTFWPGEAVNDESGR